MRREEESRERKEKESTTTIRASVNDVQFTLPSDKRKWGENLGKKKERRGACALMWSFGYSLDNLADGERGGRDDEGKGGWL